MEETSVGVKNSSGDNRKSFLRLTGYLRDQGSVGMITNLHSGMTLFLKPSEHCRAQIYSLSSQDFMTWSLVTARRIATESEAARISAKAHAEAIRIAVEVEAARIAVEVEATRITAMIAMEVEATRITAMIARKLRPLGLPQKLRPLGSPLGSLTVLLSSPLNTNRRREKGTSL